MNLIIAFLMFTVALALLLCAIFWLIAPRSYGAAFVDWFGGVLVDTWDAMINRLTGK